MNNRLSYCGLVDPRISASDKDLPVLEYFLKKKYFDSKFKFSGQGCSMEQMSSIRDQQESLAKLHFEIGARQDPSAPLSEEGNDLTNCGVSTSGIQIRYIA